MRHCKVCGQPMLSERPHLYRKARMRDPISRSLQNQQHKERSMRKLYRQGDVLFREVSQIPDGGKKRASGHIIEGEVTGHIHRVADPQLVEAEVLEVGEKLFVSVSQEGGISIIHEEHNPIVLPPGNYEVIRQREYSPQEIHNVAD